MVRTEVLSGEFKATPDEFFETIFGPAFGKEFLLLQGNKNLRIGEWKNDASGKASKVRNLAYDYPITVPIPASLKKLVGIEYVSTKVTEYYKKLPDGSIAIHAVSELSGAPIVSHISMFADYSITPITKGGDTGCTFTIHAHYGCTGMPGLNALIEATLRTGVVPAYENYVKTCIRHVPALSLPVLPSQCTPVTPV